MPQQESPRGLPRTYRQARTAFLHASERTGAWTREFRHPLTGPSGEALAMDVSWFGDASASRATVVISGVHGVEGYPGSALQSALLEDVCSGALRIGADTALVLIHAINPWGMAWGYRENEDNVDVNRNFLDFSLPLPQNADYRELHGALVREDRTASALRRADAQLQAFLERHGEARLVEAVTRGQYEYPSGLYFGGSAPCWSVRTLSALALELLDGVRHAVVIDLHTGLGPYGYGSLISVEAEGTSCFLQQQAIFGRSVISAVDGPHAPRVDGPMIASFPGLLPSARVLGLVLEFGTLSPSEDIARHRDVMWLRHHGQRDSDEGAEILRRFREFYCPTDDNWWDMALVRSRTVVRQAIEHANARLEHT